MKLKDVFKFKLSDELKRVNPISTLFDLKATRKGDEYIIEWETEDGETRRCEYLEESVEELVKNKDWIVID